MNPRIHATTILAVRRGDQLALAGDGQVTMGDVVMKHNAVKVRKLYNGKVAAGFAGAVADALTLFDRFESVLEKHHGQLRRAAVELAKDWRTDRFLRRLEAQLLVADPTVILVVSGDGEVIEPDDSFAAVGSGGPFASAAAKALLQNSNLTAAEIVRKAMDIAADLCIYTNRNVTVIELPEPTA